MSDPATPRGGFEVRLYVPCVGDWTAVCVVASVAVGRVSDVDYADEVANGSVVGVELCWVEPTWRRARRAMLRIRGVGLKATIREQ